ncbi:unnamed protein product [Owenia fusiformis]|uniref:Kynurenine/alpha-aminoadipate aminotransferase, mitochondrial n=1 Tax=Owenia fusiformis TaxID=6347 RepID=A0A8S4N6W4_OWEFU|nr:unnamed protein product [Owenia fusiformis]
MNYARFLNATSLARKPSPIRVLTELLSRSPPSMISLAGGMPNPELFPFQEADIKLRDGSTLKIDSSTMKTALQYGPTQGNAELITWMKKLQSHLHNPPTLNDDQDADSKMNICVTVGSQDGICKVFEMLVNPGDNVLLDNPTYAGTLAILRPLGVNLLGVNTDQYGMQPKSLRKILSRWSPDEKFDKNSDIPKIIYTIPNGVNPTGASLTTERKQEIYQIAQDYGLLVLEDDPYYFLQFSKTKSPSFLSMDVDGRVLRFDSFSKILSSGLRLGMVSGPSVLTNKLSLHMMASVLHCSSFSQIMVLELLKRWQIEGFLQHTEKVTAFYKEQKDCLIAAANKHLKGLAEWHEPVAGMFLWLKLLGIKDTKTLIEEKALAKEVMLVPGFAFQTDESVPCNYVRAAFSLATPEQMDTAMERLAELIREEQHNSPS